MNIYDISQKAGVSIATVSRVLNNSPHVSEATRAKVLSIIDQSKYVPNAFARGLGLNSMKTVGLLCPDASDPYLATALSLLESKFRQNGYDCLLGCTGRQRDSIKQGVESMINRHVDGMVLMGSSFIEDEARDNEYIRNAASSMPVVILNGFFSCENVYSVLCDDKKAMYDAAQTLIQKGHRHILYLHHSTNFSGQRKKAGYLQALAEAGIPADPSMICFVDKDKQSVQKVKEILFQLKNAGVNFDSVLCSEDILAVGSLKFARDAGISIPDELSVIGYNNSVLCICSEPELSSVDNKLSAICEKVAETMMGVFEGRDVPRETVFNGELIIRESMK